MLKRPIITTTLQFPFIKKT